MRERCAVLMMPANQLRAPLDEPRSWIPLALTPVSGGFPSPAQDYADKRLLSAPHRKA